MMKNILIFFSSFVFLAFSAKAQKDNGEPKDRKEEIQKIKIAYITKKLDLSVDEAQQFWPVYNNYESEIKTAVKGNEEDVIKRNEAVIGVQKKFKPSFQKILKTEKRANNVFQASTDFNNQLNKLRNRLKERRGDAPPGAPRLPGRKGGKNI